MNSPMILVSPDQLTDLVCLVSLVTGVSAFVGAAGVSALYAIFGEFFWAFRARNRLHCRRRMAARAGGVL